MVLASDEEAHGRARRDAPAVGRGGGQDARSSLRSNETTPGQWPVEDQHRSPTPVSRLVDTVLFGALPFSGIAVVGLPVSEVAMVLAIIIGLNRRPTITRSLPSWFVGLVVAIPMWLALVGIVVGNTDARRLLHLALYATLALLLAQGRFDPRAVARGLAIGLMASLGAGLVGVGSGYEGRLSGFVGDPNAAGYNLVTLGAVAMAYLRARRLRLLFGISCLALIYLTLSRTSLLATAIALAWIGMTARRRSIVPVGMLAVVIYAVGTIPQDLKVFGPFADRLGSDALRERILAAEHLQIIDSPWIGHGPGTSTVLIDGNSFFYHNSYLAARNESGWIGLGIILGLGLLTLVAMVRTSATSRNRWLEAAVVGAAVCAMNLGEVLMELPTAVALGMVVRQLSVPDPLQTENPR